jgi:hypothetical protein
MEMTPCSIMPDLNVVECNGRAAMAAPFLFGNALSDYALKKKGKKSCCEKFRKGKRCRKCPLACMA